ncbi:VWA domain-containing protein [Nitratiruptor sp. YY09-18]|uniref:VWA domain-containing protein n=1 Tax=Nitratiruptor sp. YY09-18 TaxID=2724901 RepID=UPI00191620C2|nr:VWA domain-containing protein [Nitratiruptor sp. YY09-18]BCD67560.1 hypothetical protein NitYY0918_C0459 [Nitratiruptor sp. YY09-18]
MHFVNFEFFPLMLLPSLILLYLVLTNKSLIERVFNDEILAKLRIDQGLSKKVRLSLLFSALFMMIVAMARPVYQKGVVEVESLQGNLVVALDISRSMRAKDIYPDRIHFAKKKIEDLLGRLENIAVGVETFGNGAYILTPPTADKEALLYLLDKLNIDNLIAQGTDFLAALSSANMLLKDYKEKNVLLVTDGGDKSEFSKEIAYAKAHHLRVYVLGVGTAKGAPIPDGAGGYVQYAGKIVITKRNDAIAALAHATGGKYVVARLDNKDIDELLQLLKEVQKTKKSQKIVDQVEFYPYFVALALLFLALSFFDIPGKGVVFVLPLVLNVHLHAGLSDFKVIKEAKDAYKRGNYKEAARLLGQIAKEKGSPQSYYDYANALYKNKEYKRAIENYNRVQTENKELEFKKLYNLGNSYFMLQNYQKAIEMYQKALAIKDDEDARYNLELAKKMLKKKQQQSNKQKQNQQKQQKQQHNQNNQQKNQQQKQKEEEQKQQKQETQQLKSGQKNQPITNREEKKWLRQLKREQNSALLYKIPDNLIKKEEKNENPW